MENIFKDHVVKKNLALKSCSLWQDTQTMEATKEQRQVGTASLCLQLHTQKRQQSLGKW